jgi:hypothetical protein
MTKKPIYCYETDKYHIHSLDKTDIDHTEMVRLLAENGRVLTKDGVNFCTVIDIKLEDEHLWREIERPQ